MVTVGGVKSLDVVTVTGSDVHSPPAVSRATAVKTCEPLLVVRVFHEIEYGNEVSSSPRLAPSSLNCTPATMSVPLRTTSALTGIVPLTVDPEVGDVIVTTRLLIGSCADACCGDIHART